MGKKNRSPEKKVYKRNAQKVYIKGDAKANRQEKISDLLARVVAMLLYPFYLLVMKVIALKKGNLKQTATQQKKKTKKEKADFKAPKVAMGMRDFLIKIKELPQQFKKINIKAFNPDKVKALFSRYLKYINTHKVVVSGAIAVLAVAVIGFNAISGLAPQKTIESDLASEAHVISVESASAKDLEPLITKPVLEDIGFASVRAYEIVVNGHVLAHFKTEEECQSVLDELVSTYTENTDSKILDWYYSEQVEIVKGFQAITEFNGYDDSENMLSYIVKGTKEEKTHVVQKGENYWVIAQYYGINPSDLEAANPNVKPETLQIGQKISLIVPKPLISVCTVEEAEYIDNIPFEVAYEDTANLYKDESSVKVKGVAGERAVIASLTKENGREISRTILEETVLSEPTTKVVYRGTKDPPPKMGTGVLKKPTSRGSVTSEFGYRWNARHEGIDIGLPVGSEVRAADGGIVTFAGYSSSYGYYVKIDHGGNMMTLYAHNSRLVVSKGDKVYQGQLISYSGNTGRSTGPHLHFEVRKNGTPVNPRNYVNF